ncbi:MAG: hypothetical protein ABF289_06730 [Clostridiales bacterium]
MKIGTLVTGFPQSYYKISPENEPSLIINSCDTNSGNLHLNISVFSIDASDLFSG